MTILTGRLYSGTRPSAEAIGINGPVGCVDGSHVVHAGTHRTVLHHGIRGAHALTLRDALAQSGASTFLFARDAIVHDDGGDDFLGYVATWSQELERAHSVTDHPYWEHDDGVTAVVAVGSVDQIQGVATAVNQNLADHAQVAVFPVRRPAGREAHGRAGGERWGLVARARGGTKGTALRWLAEHHAVDLRDTVVIGDWHNDIPMFETAGAAYAMAQAPEELRAIATAVLPESGYDGGGIARVIREVFDIDPDAE